jgi:aspartate/methionine/tyrosine aminotransferase
MSARTASAIAAQSAPLNLTQHEIQAMRTRYNLAAAHCRQPMPHGIVQSLPELWRQAEEKQQQYFEHQFREHFFALRRQPAALATGRTLLSYSASVSTVVAATLLMQRGMSVTLIEPCVDNLADILRNMRVPLEAIDETALSGTDDVYQELVHRVRTDALFLVDPNNPTGFTLPRRGRRGFEQVVRYCVDYGKVLVLDLCFAAFALPDDEHDRFDVYELLEESGVTYLAIEDTGKTWPVRDAKCALLTVSEDVWGEVLDIHTGIQLNVSPFVLNVLTRHVRDAMRDNLSSVRDVITRNRETALRALDGSLLVHQQPAVTVSVGWFRIADETVTATALHQALVEAEVYVLPGTYFYWNNPFLGERFVRIALARSPDMFAAAMTRLRTAVDRWTTGG